MATTKFYLDTRAVKGDNYAPLKVVITKHGHASYISLDVKLLPSQWDEKRQRATNIENQNKINNYIYNRKVQIDNAIMELSSRGELTKMTSTQIKNKVKSYLDPKAEIQNLFINRYKKFTESRNAERTKEIYETTLNKILTFDKNATSMSFEDINKDWLISFDNFLKKEGLKKNSRNIHFRNIRAVINDAIDNEITTHYPMRKMDINPEETEKRSLTIEELRLLFNYPVKRWQQKYLDYFKLTFYLIGINPVDLCNCKKEDIKDGRLIYKRRKTGKLYSIKIEKEAQEIIEKYSGEKLLVNFSERMTNYKTFVSRANKALKKIGIVNMVYNSSHSKKNKFEYKPLFNSLSIYWARHTWATLAYSIGISDELIAAALGHSHGNRITSIYINKSIANIDDVNRKVIDYVLNQ